MNDNCWYWKGGCLPSIPSGYYGFIYKITNKENGFIYIGKKAFIHNKKTKISKKIKKATGTRKRIEKTQVDSDWKNYFGSSSYLLDDLEKNNYNCTREILKLCKDKTSLSFWEVVYLIEYDVLFRDDCYNGHIGGKYYKGKIHK